MGRTVTFLLSLLETLLSKAIADKAKSMPDTLYNLSYHLENMSFIYVSN